MITGYNTLMYEMWFRQRRWRRDLHLTTSFRISSSFMFCQYNIYLHTKWEFACSVLYKVSSTCVTDGNFSDFSFIQYLTRKLSSSPSINRKDMNSYSNFPSIHDTPYQCQRYQQVKRSKEDTSCCWWQFMCHQLSTVRHPPTQQSPRGIYYFPLGVNGWVDECMQQFPVLSTAKLMKVALSAHSHPHYTRRVVGVMVKSTCTTGCPN